MVDWGDFRMGFGIGHGYLRAKGNGTYETRGTYGHWVPGIQVCQCGRFDLEVRYRREGYRRHQICHWRRVSSRIKHP